MTEQSDTPHIDPMQDPMRPAYFVGSAENETPAEAVLRKLAYWLGVGGYNASKVDADVFHAKIVDGINSILGVETQRRADLEHQLTQALKENEGLRRVIAEKENAHTLRLTIGGQKYGYQKLFTAHELAHIRDPHALLRYLADDMVADMSPYFDAARTTTKGG